MTADKTWSISSICDVFCEVHVFAIEFEGRQHAPPVLTSGAFFHVRVMMTVAIDHMGESTMQVSDYLTDATIVFFIANSLYVISYMLTSMLWLRVLAIVAAASTFPYFYFQIEPLWSALFWQACFLTVNLVNLLILFYSMRAADFNEEEELAYHVKFSDLKPYEIRPIFKYAKHMTIEPGHVLLNQGQANETLYLILKGECRVVKNDMEIAVLRQGHFVGELSFISDHEVSADVIAAKDTTLMSWNKSSLRPLFKRQGLYEAYFYSLCSVDVAGKLRKMTTARAAP